MITDADKLKLVAVVMVRQLCTNAWANAAGQPMPPCFKGDPSAPVTKEDEAVLANLKAKDQKLHDQLWKDAAAICEALERAEGQGPQA